MSCTIDHTKLETALWSSGSGPEFDVSLPATIDVPSSLKEPNTLLRYSGAFHRSRASWTSGFSGSQSRSASLPMSPTACHFASAMVGLLLTTHAAAFQLLTSTETQSLVHNARLSLSPLMGTLLQPPERRMRRLPGDAALH